MANFIFCAVEAEHGTKNIQSRCVKSVRIRSSSGPGKYEPEKLRTRTLFTQLNRLDFLIRNCTKCMWYFEPKMISKLFLIAEIIQQQT